ncbi:hypothetical protein GQ600_573 [Phytophthora cactorum]|nr:hypothetical protein GQ600_573 [Phytophthora cactorum]
MKLLDPKLCPDKRMNVISDSAFPCSSEMTAQILTPLKDGGIDRILPSLRGSARTMHNVITSARQVAEWGMESMRKVFVVLISPPPYRKTPNSAAFASIISFALSSLVSGRSIARRFGQLFLVRWMCPRR